MGKDFLITDRLRNCSRRKKREIVSRMGEASSGKILFIFFLSYSLIALIAISAININVFFKT